LKNRRQKGKGCKSKCSRTFRCGDASEILCESVFGNLEERTEMLVEKQFNLYEKISEKKEVPDINCWAKRGGVCRS